MSSKKQRITLDALDANLQSMAAAYDQYSYPGYLKDMTASIEKHLVEKQSQFSGEEYLSQIEKNAVYFIVGTWGISTFIATFLIGEGTAANDVPKPKSGEPWSEEQIQALSTYLRFLGKKEQSSHLAFIRYACDGCEFHVKHWMFESWRRMRQHGKLSAYIDEMEFSYLYYRWDLTVAQLILRGYLLTGEHSGFAAGLRLPDVESVLRANIHKTSDRWKNSWLSKRGETGRKPVIHANILDP